jgi:hypothetical protein
MKILVNIKGLVPGIHELPFSFAVSTAGNEKVEWFIIQIWYNSYLNTLETTIRLQDTASELIIVVLFYSYHMAQP